jgi:hypothetical protein
MRLRWLGPGLIALALGTSYPRTARAQSDVVSTAVLGLEATDVPIALTDEIAEQLRQRVSATRDMRLVSGKDLVEVKLVFSCADEAASCMAQAGKSLDAQKLIYGSVKKVGEDYAIWLKMLDVRKARIEFWLTETLLKKQADSAGIKMASGRWFAKLTGRPVNAGTLQVAANVTGAVVSLDGVPVGATAEQPLLIADVTAGKHDLAVAKPGHETVKEQVTVAVGQTVSINLSLQPIRVAPASAADSNVAPKIAAPPTIAPDASGTPGGTPARTEVTESADGYRTGFWVTLAAGLATIGGAVKFGLDVSDVNVRLDQYRRFPCTANPGQLCDASKTMVRAPLTQDERNKVGNLNDEGTRAQTLQWICIGVGSALGVASGYLFYKGFLDSEDGHGRRQAHQGLRIFPTAGASSGGIQAEFDF